ncbi:MAG TPA: hypothetical protein VHB98_14345 [Chloroflexota bacterium]|nr:hypothetical protein [Chloroflexota bacterium]
MNADPATLATAHSFAAGSPVRAVRSARDVDIARVIRWLCLTCLLFYLFTAGSNFSSGDAQSELRVDQGLVDHGWVDVPQGKTGQLCGGWGCQGVDGRFYATHGIGYSLYLLPFYVVALVTANALQVTNCGQVGQPLATHSWNYCVPIHLVSWANSLLAAATVALLCLLCLELGYSLRRSLALALLYGFATLAWPYARYGFDVTLTALLLLAAFREALIAAGNATCLMGGSVTAPRRWLRAGGLAALAVLVRLPAAAAIAPLALFLLVVSWKQPFMTRLRMWIAFAAPLVLSLAFTCWYNWARFGSASPLADGHAANSAESLTTPPWVSIPGMLISPGKGLLWYTPLVLMALLCIPALYARHRAACTLALAMAACGLLPYLPVQDWIGGDAWGPRFTLQVLPFLVLPAIELPTVLRSRLSRLLAVALLLVSVILQLAGCLVDYNLRLRWYRGHGISTDQIIWDPRYSPLGDHVQVLWSYITHWQTARLTSNHGASFDLWWLNLWRNDGKSPALTLLAGGLVGLLGLLALWRLVRSLPRSAPSAHPR